MVPRLEYPRAQDVVFPLRSEDYDTEEWGLGYSGGK